MLCNNTDFLSFSVIRYVAPTEVHNVLKTALLRHKSDIPTHTRCIFRHVN